MDMFGITGLIPLSGPSDSDYGGGNDPSPISVPG